MNIAVFADLHGRVLLAFQLCARWQQETGEHIDLILQAGDLGAFSEVERLDKATRRHAEHDPTELGFLEHFRKPTPSVAALLARTTCPLVFVRGNHEDHSWLDALEAQSEEATFPIDAYMRVCLLKTGLPLIFQKSDEQITILGIGRIEAPQGEDYHQSKYIQDYELERLYQLEHTPIDILLTHESRPDSVVFEHGVNIRTGHGMKEIGYLLERARPAYHFFGHYGGPSYVCTDPNGTTLSVKLADLHWQRGNRTLEIGSMGLLRWRNQVDHSFTVLDDPWLREYTIQTWCYL